LVAQEKVDINVKIKNATRKTKSICFGGERGIIFMNPEEGC